ncbi:MAG: methyltransferase domain-containing protein [Ginsengibacter sp.]
MKQFNSPVEAHYYQEGIFEHIVQLLRASGKDKIAREDIEVVDEFHVRGAAVSLELAAEVGFDKDTLVLDVGCGLGGPCRMLAAKYGCKVTGIDVTEEFIRTAKLLSKETGLEDLTTFICGNALHLPFEKESFDVVWTQHVQMNIEDKHTFYSEIKRVLKKGGRFIYYDIFSKNHEPVHFPVPWAMDKSLSFLMTVNELDWLLTAGGFKKIETRDQTPEAVNFFTKLVETTAKEGPPTVGVFVLMGKNTPEKLSGLVRNIKEKKLELQSGMYQG